MRTLYVSLAIVLILATAAFSSVNAGPTWNQVAASRNFDGYPAGDNGSFAQHYHGSNLAGDFASMVGYINQTLGTSINPEYDDLMNATLENWGSGNGKN
jgi:hypothetical protein